MIDDTVTYTAELKLPTLEANLMKYGEIRELKHPWFKRTFEAGKDGNQVDVLRFKNMLASKGYKTERKDDDKLLVMKGSLSVLLVFHYPPFSDSTIEQIDYIFDTLDQEVRDVMQDSADDILTRSGVFWAEQRKQIKATRERRKDVD